MFLDRLFQKSGIPLMKKSLDAAALRQRAIASNIANIGTPGYRQKRVVFEETLQQSMKSGQIEGKSTDPRHIPIGRSKLEQLQPEVKTNDSDERHSGVNNVDIDHEMAEMAKNQIRFSSTATLLARRFKGLTSAIRGK